MTTMTDQEVLSEVFARIDPSATAVHLVRRNGRILLGLPNRSDAAARTLRLYQPQRALARTMAMTLQGLAAFGLHGRLLPQVRLSAPPQPFLTGSEPGSCGVLLGSPEHRVRRAIASYRNAGEWEVAKIAFGEEGARVLEGEARTLEDLQSLAAGIPRLLGLHRDERVTILRMPYLAGSPVRAGESSAAIELLNRWISGQPPRPIEEFPEWPQIERALAAAGSGTPALNRLSGQSLRPVICHGDFARWNLLRQPDGGLSVLDWEWGHHDGLPGIDLVHYFLQDFRLVRRLPADQAIAATVDTLKQADGRRYLEMTGWQGDPILPVIACLAYKQGAGHQQNEAILNAALSFC